MACGVLVPQPGTEPRSPAVEVWNLNHWTTRKVPLHLLMTLIFHWETLGLYSQSNWFGWNWPLPIPHMPTLVTWAWPTVEFQALGHNATPVQWGSIWNLVGIIGKEVGLFLLDLCLLSYQRGTHLMGEACSSCVSITFEEPGRLQSMGSQRIGHDWATSLSLFKVFSNTFREAPSVFPPSLSNQKFVGSLVRLPCLHADPSLRDLNSSWVGLLLGSGSLLL